MPKGNRKFREKVKALKKIAWMPEVEAQTFAKKSKLVRLKKKRVILSGPNKELICTLVIADGQVHFLTPDGIEVIKGDKPEQPGCRLVFKMPPNEKKDKNKKVDAEAAG